MSIQAIVEDLEAVGGGLPGYVLARVKEKLRAGLDSSKDIDQTEYLERLVIRVRTHYQQLLALEVPPQEIGRHQRLLCAFEVYEEALEAFLQCLEAEDLACDPELIEDLNWADHVVHEHRQRSQYLEVNTLF